MEQRTGAEWHDSANSDQLPHESETTESAVEYHATFKPRFQHDYDAFPEIYVPYFELSDRAQQTLAGGQIHMDGIVDPPVAESREHQADSRHLPSGFDRFPTNGITDSSTDTQNTRR